MNTPGNFVMSQLSSPTPFVYTESEGGKSLGELPRQWYGRRGREGIPLWISSWSFIDYQKWNTLDITGLISFKNFHQVCNIHTLSCNTSILLAERVFTPFCCGFHCGVSPINLPFLIATQLVSSFSLLSAMKIIFQMMHLSVWKQPCFFFFSIHIFSCNQISSWTYV